MTKELRHIVIKEYVQTISSSMLLLDFLMLAGSFYAVYTSPKPMLYSFMFLSVLILVFFSVDRTVRLVGNELLKVVQSEVTGKKYDATHDNLMRYLNYSSYLLFVIAIILKLLGI